jgi:hypothetical protein
MTMARLPVPGSDDNTWGTVLNDYLSQSLDSTGQLKSGVVGASQVTDGALPQAKITNLVSDLAGKAALSHTHALRASTDYNNTVAPGTGQAITWNGSAYAPAFIVGDPYPISEYGFFTASASLSSGSAQSTVGPLFFSRIYIPPGFAISVIALVVSAAGTLGAGGGNCFAIYNDTGTLLASTPVDDNLWASTGWRMGTLASPIAAQSTGRFVYATPFVVGYSSPPSICYTYVGNGSELFYRGNNKPNHRRAFYGGGGSLPASINPVTFGSESGYLPLIAIG